MYRALKLYTDRGTEANQVVLSVPDEDGFAAWVMLHRRFGMALSMRQGVALASFSNLGQKRCNTPAETRTRVIEIDRVARATEEVTGETIGEGHWKSVLVQMLDPVTRQHTAALMGSGTSVADFKRAILEFTANVSVDKDIMDIGRISQETEEGTGSRTEGGDWVTTGEWETEAAGANAVGRGVPRVVAGTAAATIMLAVRNVPRKVKVEKGVRDSQQEKVAKVPPRLREEEKARRGVAGTVEEHITATSAPTRAKARVVKARVPMAFGSQRRMSPVGPGPTWDRSPMAESKAFVV